MFEPPVWFLTNQIINGSHHAMVFVWAVFVSFADCIFKPSSRGLKPHLGPASFVQEAILDHLRGNPKIGENHSESEIFCSNIMDVFLYFGSDSGQFHLEVVIHADH